MVVTSQLYKIFFIINNGICYNADMEIKVSRSLKELAKILKKEAELFIVGGYVRNAILKVGTTDIDITSRLSPEELEIVLVGTEYKVKEKSKKLGTVIVISPDGDKWEHTTFRKEFYADDGRHVPDEAIFVNDIREDARRRDFTVNSVYYNILKEELVDFYDGETDTEHHVIKCVETPSKVFDSDGLRILRMIRFACELNFKINSQTFVKACEMSYRLKDITGARKLSELELILASSERYLGRSKANAHIRGLELINKMKIWPQFYVHTNKIKFDMVKKVSAENRFIGLLIDIIDCVKPDDVNYYLQFLLSSTGLPVGKKVADYYSDVICGYYDALMGMKNKNYFLKHFDNFPKISKFLIQKSKRINVKYEFFYKYIIKYKLAISIKDLKVNGDDLKKKVPELSEKKYGVALGSLLDKVFDGKLQNEPGELLKEVRDNIKNY